MAAMTSLSRRTVGNQHLQVHDRAPGATPAYPGRGRSAMMPGDVRAVAEVVARYAARAGEIDGGHDLVLRAACRRHTGIDDRDPDAATGQALQSG